MSKPETASPQPFKLAANPEVRSVFSDAALIVRHPDGMVWFRFCNKSIIPGQLAEEARIVLTEDHARSFLDALRGQLDPPAVPPPDAGKTAALPPSGRKSAE